ncbi:MAG: hypothetical protein ACXABK_00355 [Candidatus Heimdallarchaeaceae archaeon]|jgi:cytoskeletal protein CcmA (bactofilin family)
MSEHEHKMYEELLELLEKKRKEDEIDQAHYEELKERYEKKLAKAKQLAEEIKATPKIKISGAQTISDTEVSVSGSARINGGEMDKDIRIAGSGRFLNDVVCRNLRASGSLKGEGSITAHGDVKTSGSFKCGGFLHADGDVKFSGSAKVANEAIIGGRLSASGSFSCGDYLQAENGARVSGSTSINGNLLSQSTVELAGRAQIEGNLVGEDVYINKDVIAYRLKKTRPSTVKGSVFGTREVVLRNTIVEQDVKGLDVEIGPHSRVRGTVYYVNNISVDKKAQLSTEPVQISADQLKL